VRDNLVDFDSIKLSERRQLFVDKRQSFCLLIEICGVGADVVIWHENMILCNEFDVTKVLYDDRHRFLQNTLIR
jgi:hypothetical protein